MSSNLIRKFRLFIYKYRWYLISTLIRPNCRLCSGTTVRKVGYGRYFLECRSCGFIFAGDFPESVAQIGAGMSGSWGDADTGGEREDFLVRFIHKDLEKQSFLLYGVGSTLAFPVLISERFDVYGCDVSESVIEYRQKKYGIDRFFHANKLESIHNKYDVVVACEVIEHLNYPQKAFSTILNCMKLNGILCGTTNFHPGGDIEDGQKVGYMSFRNHVAYWSEKSMTKLLGNFGMNLITFEMVCPGSVKPDLKYNDLFPNKRVFFASADEDVISFLIELKSKNPILPIDLSDYPHPSYRSSTISSKTA